MPDLPTLTVTQAQANRMLDAFGSVENYKAWLKSMIIQYVVAQEAAVADEQYRVGREAANERARQELS